ncbi:MAG: mannose-1-phosphate guanylyltransferase [Pseudomonadota bacterium]|nr:mannose-1-phosphate guanylyltransferase [Pseudomonadota bacterium]
MTTDITTEKNNLHAVILAGGSGTRFWPLSRHRRPKQLIPLLGGKTTLEATIERLSPLTDDSRTMVVTNKDQALAVEKLLASRFSQARIIAEPVGRNTAPAIALAAQLLIMDQGPETTMMVFPADHYISDLPEFIHTLELAATVAKQGWLVTLGIAPSRPETGYGYIQSGNVIEFDDDIPSEKVRKVSRFVEKPDARRATEYLASGDYFWNSGIFIWRTDVILAEIARHLPAVDACLQRFCRECQNLGFDQALAAYFREVEAISIDYGVLEKSSRVVVVPSRFSWSDLGSWDALDELKLQPRVESENEKPAAETMLFSAKNNTVFSRKPTALIDVDDLLVVDTEDALLICKKGSSQRVKEVVEHLRQQEKDSLL